MPKTQSKKSSSRSAIYSAAKKLFWKHGISRITVEEIAREAEVSKMTFYRQFENKYVLANEILMDQVKEGREAYRKIMDAPIPFKERLIQFMDLKRNKAQDISLELVSDLYLNPENSQELLDLIERESQLSKEQILCDFQLAQENGELRQDLNLQFVLLMIHQMENVIKSPEALASFSSPQELVDNMMQFFIHGIIEPSQLIAEHKT